jgi:hypothetical protein
VFSLSPYFADLQQLLEDFLFQQLLPQNYEAVNHYIHQFKQIDCGCFATRMVVRASLSVKVVKRLGLCITVEVFCRNCNFISDDIVNNIVVHCSTRG